MNCTHQERLPSKAFNFSDDQAQNDEQQYLAEKRGMFSDQIDFLAADSYRTIQRESLKIVPESLQAGIHSQDKQDFVSTLISPYNSQVFQKEGSEQNEIALIRQTEELTLKQCATSVEYEGYKEGDREEGRADRRRLHRVQYIKNPKQLIKQLKRQYKYGNDIKGDIILSVEGQATKLKSASIKPIIDDKKHLSAIIITHSHQQYKIQVINLEIGYFNPSLQLWDSATESWNELQFKIKLLNI